MMKILCPIFIAITTLSGCTKKEANNGIPVITNMTNNDITVKASDSTFTYLALGDSYTIGQSVPADQSYPNLLAS